MGIYNVRFNGHDTNWCIQHTEKNFQTRTIHSNVQFAISIFLESQVQFMDIHLTDRQTLFNKQTKIITSHIHMMHQDEDITYIITC